MSAESFKDHTNEENTQQCVFQELPKILKAYAYAWRTTRTTTDPLTIPGDIDTLTRPSLGMRTYLRMAARHPGRATCLVAELETLIEQGPDSEIIDALVDAGITEPSKLRPSDGKDPAEFFRLMLVHLRRFTDSGEQTEDAFPETPWEWRERFDRITGLFSGFYMYWTDDYPDHQAVIEEYLSDYMDAEYCSEILAQLRELRGICADESDLEKGVRKLAFNGRPPEGMSFGEWVANVDARLEQYIQENA